MKAHIGRLALGGIVMTLAWVLYWAVETFRPVAGVILAIAAVLAFAYLIGAFILAVWDGNSGIGL